MIFKLVAKELYSDEGLFIKKLHCPHLIKWQRMGKVDGSQDKLCSSCRKTITDTETISDEQVINLQSLGGIVIKPLGITRFKKRSYMRYI